MTNYCRTSSRSRTKNLINNSKEGKTIAEEVNFNDGIEQFNQRKAFFTLKDHKVNFQNDAKCRLINQANSEIEIITKHHLEIINNKIREKTQVNQW